MQFLQSATAESRMVAETLEETMRIAQVPAIIEIHLKREIISIPWPEGAVFFFPESKTEFNLFELREIIKEMEKMNGPV